MSRGQAREFSVLPVVVAAVMLFVGLAVPASALGASHPFKEVFGSANEPSFVEPEGLAVDQSTGDLLVIDGEANTVSRWNPDGTPADFNCTPGPNCTVSGNEITGLSFGTPGEVQLAVDNSGGATDGDIYVPQAGAKVVDIFASTGEFIGQLTESAEGAFTEPCGVAVDPSGNVYVGDFSGHIHKFANPPVNGASTDFAFSGGGNCTLAAGAGLTEGALFAAHFNGSIEKLSSTTGAEEYEVDAGPTRTLSVDPNSGHLYSASGEEIREFDASGTSATKVSSTALPSAAFGVAVNGSTGNFYASREGDLKVEVYGPQFELKIDKTGPGTGTVTSSPAGIDCGSECSAAFGEGEVVELEAAPGIGSEFAGWSTVVGNPGTCTGTISPCEVTMSEAVELEAEFAIGPPAVTGVVPTKGPTVGGNQVEITGAALGGATKVEFGTTAVNAPFIENTNGAIKLEAPAHAAGTVDVTVTTGIGTSPVTAADEYTYVEAPVVTGLSPAEGSTAGGNQVEIAGTNLAEATKVEFDNAVVSAPFAEDTETTIKLNAPQHSAGTFDVTVTTAGGPSANSAVDEYTYVAPPAVTAVNPTHGPTTGGNAVEITGLRLSEATKVEFGTAVVNAPFTENTATTIKLKAPPHVAGTVDVRVTTIGGISGKFPPDNYTFAVPSHTLTVSHAGSGSGSVTCNGGACASSYTEGTSVTLAASAASGSSFAGWSGGGCSGPGSCTVTLNANVAVTATFSANPPPPPPPPSKCVVPKVKGLSLNKAKEALSKAHCKTGKVTKPKNKKGPLVVKSSTPGAGTSMAADSKVDLKLGPKPKKKK